MDPAVLFDSELVRRYDRPGPRYTSYPAAPLFSTEFGEAELLEQARRSNQELIPRPLSLYVHVPFCHSPCFYCGCNRVITRDPAKGSRYLERLLREVELVTPLFDPDRRVVQLHFGGGTPNFLGPAQLALLMEKLDTGFNFSAAPGRDFSIELDPRHVHAADIAAYARMGLNRASIGVQDFDPDVQRAVNRIQGVTETERRFAIGFGTYFADVIPRLEQLAEDGLLTLGESRIAATSRGRFLLRIIAMCFDRYIEQAVPDATPRDSRAI